VAPAYEIPSQPSLWFRSVPRTVLQPAMARARPCGRPVDRTLCKSPTSRLKSLADLRACMEGVGLRGCWAPCCIGNVCELSPEAAAEYTRRAASAACSLASRCHRRSSSSPPDDEVPLSAPSRSLRMPRFFNSIAILYHEVPNPNLTIRNFCIAVSPEAMVAVAAGKEEGRWRRAARSSRGSLK
jgi:hypothetical protein